MAAEFTYVQALENACWRSHRQMIVSLVESRWGIDSVGVHVVPNVVYSFEKDADADYLLNIHVNEHGVRDGAPRAVPVNVEKNMIVAFWRKEDALFFVNKGVAREVTEAELMQMLEPAAEPPPPPAPEPQPEPQPEEDADEVEASSPETDGSEEPPKPKRGRRKASTS